MNRKWCGPEISLRSKTGQEVTAKGCYENQEPEKAFWHCCNKSLDPCENPLNPRHSTIHCVGIVDIHIR